MDPIISPWLVWLTGVTGIVQIVCGIIGSGCGIVGVVCGAIGKLDDDPKLVSFAKRCILPALICIPLTAVIPSKNTMIAMIVAHEVTDDRIEEVACIYRDVLRVIDEE